MSGPEARAPLSFHQEGLWLASMLQPAASSYNNILGLRLRGPLDVGALRRSLDEIVRRHEALRTRFEVTDGSPVQAIAEPPGIPLAVLDASGERGAVDDAALLEQAARECRRPFDLAAGPLIRPTLLRAGAEDHLLAVAMHHIVSDGWSVGILLRELAAIYPALASGRPSPLPPPRSQYRDYVRRQRQRLQGERLGRELSYWRRQLDGAPPILDLPTDHPRGPRSEARGGTFPFSFPAQLTHRLRELARAEGTTLFAVLLAGFVALMHRYTGQDDLLVGTPITNRLNAELEDAFGYFLNMLVIRGDLSGDPTFRELLQRVKGTLLGAFSHMELPFDRLLQELRPARDQGRSPLFQVVFTLQPGAEQGPELRIPGLDVEPVEIAPGASKYDLTLCMFDGEGVSGHLEYDACLFEEATIVAMAGHLRTLVEAALQAPDRRLSALPMLSARERVRALYEWNEPMPEPAERCIHELFEEQADRTPAAVAVVVGSERWTYARLDARANQLARRLRALGVGPDRFVAVVLDRPEHTAVSLLAVLKASGAYVALDPSHPRERLRVLMEELRVGLILTEGDLPERLPAGGLPILRLDADRCAIAAESERRLGAPVRPPNLAYAVFTSGSTGLPKAVGLEHRSAVSMLRWSHAAYGREALTGVLAGTSACFDCVLFDLFAPLAVGGTAVVAASLLDLPELAARREVRMLSTVPSVIAELLRRGGVPESVRIVNLGGEALQPSLVERLYESTAVERLYNLYGSSETTTYATRTLVRPGPARVTIGRPITGARAYVVDRGLQLVPAGVPGQLCVGGAGVARGYLGRPGLTAARFLPDPFSEEPGARLYLTGDRARFLPDGELEFLGRLDDQVKIRGIRIEPGEVQAVLSGHPDLQECAVLPARAADTRDLQLVAYVVPRAGREAPASALRDYLRERLPAFLVPSAFVAVERFPLNQLGKIDRRLLPEPGLDDARPFVAPRTPDEELVAGIWAGALDVPRVGVDDNFFELGGHSLLAARIVSAIREAMGVEVPLTAIFEAGSLGEFAQRVRAARQRGDEPAITPVPRGRPLPLSFSQRRLWFLEQLRRRSIAYNVPLALRLTGPLDAAALEAALNELVRRHEALRSRFQEEAGVPAQTTLPELRLELPVVELEGSRAEREAAMGRLARAQVTRPFDLAREPLIRARLLRLAADEHVLVLVLHHIVTDGWSMRLLRQELAVLYRAFAAGAPSPLEEPLLRYADFADWQQRQLVTPHLREQLGYWKRRLAGLPQRLDLPLDLPRPLVRREEGATRLFKISPAVTEGLRRLSKSEGATLFMTLHAAFTGLLHRWSGRDDIWMGTPVAGRNRVELERIVGLFLNTLVLRTDAGGNPTFRELLRRARAGVLEALANQDVQFEQLVDELNVRRDLSQSPLFQVMFTLHHAMGDEAGLHGLQVREVTLENPTTKVDLDLTVIDADEFLYGGLNYSVDLFEPATVKRMVRCFQHLLAGAVADPDRPVADLPLMAGPERRRVLALGRGPAPEPAARPVHELFEAQAARSPSAPAVIAGDRSLTYRELDRGANQLAHRLLELGVRPDEPVALCVDRSSAMVTGLLGIAKAGAAYVPLDPGYPRERLTSMLRDSGARMLVTQATLRDAVPLEVRDVIRLDADAAALATMPEVRPPRRAGPDHLAYVIYTSGSTGRPNGVAVTHRSLTNLLRSFAADPGIGAGDTAVAVTSLSFDIASLELLLPLLAGARLVVAGAATAGDGARLRDLVERSGATFVQATPATWRMLLDAGWTGGPGLTALCGGETLPPDLAERLLAQSVRLRNVYGPTETTIWSTQVHVEPGARPTIGRPIAGTRAHVLDGNLEPVPVGVPGELFLGGVGLARGYHRRPGLTAERFVPDPFGEAGERLYRTGDVARVMADGTLEHLGRRDQQIKVRGFRIELGEVEAALTRHPAVAMAAVAVRELDPGEANLVAYLVPARGAELPETAELRAHLRGTLPEHMVPGAFLRLDAIPLTPNGKVDRRGLPDPNEAGGTTPYVAPRSPDEAALAAIWSELLGVDEVGVRDDFFELGGQSLLATRVTSRLRRELGVDIPLQLVFQATTIEELAPYLQLAREHGGELPAEPGARECAGEPVDSAVRSGG